MRRLFGVFLLAAFLPLAWAEVKVTNVEVKPRWPWNGKVDITYSIECDERDDNGNPKDIYVDFTGIDGNRNQTVKMKSLTGDFLVKPGGPYKVTWDAGKDYPSINSSIFQVSVHAVSPTPYLVINLKTWSKRYTNQPPNLDDDTCRTTELWLRQIPAGTFMMGSPQNEEGRQSYDCALHEVTISHMFYIGLFECTQRQWELVMGTRPSYFCYNPCYETRPVENVSYNMIRGSSNFGVGWPTYGHTVDGTSYVIPDGVTTIDENAFKGCASLATLYIPASVEEGLEYEIMDCTGLNEILVDENNENYLSKDGVLFSRDKTQLLRYPPAKVDTSYAIPVGVTTIGEYAFEGCSGLVSINIPNGVTTIGESAFEGCASLATLYIPASVEEGLGSAIKGCTGMRSIEVSELNEEYASVDGVLFSKSLDYLIQYPAKRAAIGYSIPEGVERVSGRAFFGSANLVSVTVPASVETIGGEAFAGCDNLKVIVFKGEPPEFWDWDEEDEVEDDSYPTPITFFVPAEMGWEDWDVPEGVTLVYGEPQVLELTTGWNLVTLTSPVTEESMTHFLALQPMRLDTAKGCYVRCRDSKDIEVGGGYWVFSKTNQSVMLVQDKSQVEWDAAKLLEGWNLIGVAENSDWMSQATGIWQWLNGLFQMVTDEQLSVGKAYWVK